MSWHFDGHPLEPSRYESLMYHGDYNTTVHELTIARAGAREVGTYRCVTPFGTAEITVDMFG